MKETYTCRCPIFPQKKRKNDQNHEDKRANQCSPRSPASDFSDCEFDPIFTNFINGKDNANAQANSLKDEKDASSPPSFQMSDNEILEMHKFYQKNPTPKKKKNVPPQY